MKPALAFPYNDPDGTMLPHLQSILPDLKNHFDHAYISPPRSTFEWLQQKNLFLADDFFTVYPVDGEKSVGERFAYVYQRAAEDAHPEQIVHLCYPDRMAFALEGAYRDSFLADIDSLIVDDLPLIFHRSPLAWDTHPQNYRKLEGIVTTVGMNLFGKGLDYAWCHLVVQAKQLREVIPLTTRPDISMVAEMILHMQADIKTREVDWLAWEDPFIFGRNAQELKRERESSLDETNKRLNYVLPMIEMLTRFSKNGRK
ncbi:MAG: hypothetical protein IPP66_05070 [Anaerolineales bacterium]|nr:hypothetical protein [Anaerolineales bacterium]